MRSFLALLAAAGLPLANSLSLNVNSPDSIRDASATIAYGLMSWYTNNQSTTPAVAIGTFNQPIYWWEAGAVWGGLIDYWAYTGDTSYVETVQQALLAQTGPDLNYMPAAYDLQLGNDDQAFWAYACLAALEYDFPVPSGKPADFWLQLSENVFNTMVPRWDTSSCGGGLRWQIFKYNAGWTYKNTVSNGGLFQIAARLYRYTGNQVYLDWAEKTWDWMADVGLISADYHVSDGSTDTDNCTHIDRTPWSYNAAALIYGTAMLYNRTESQVWEARTTGLLDFIGRTFFSPFKNSTNIMYEPGCELKNICDTDQFSFKAYLSRWLSKSTLISLSSAHTSTIKTLVTASASAAARSCSGPTSYGGAPTACGHKWYTGSYDGSYGPGQELSALETIQSLLLLSEGTGWAIRRFPVLAAGLPGNTGGQPKGGPGKKSTPTTTAVETTPMTSLTTTATPDATTSKAITSATRASDVTTHSTTASQKTATSSEAVNASPTPGSARGRPGRISGGSGGHGTDEGAAARLETVGWIGPFAFMVALFVPGFLFGGALMR